MNILIVEDELALVSVIKEANKEWGFNMYSTHDSKTALEKVKMNKYEVILLDIYLPDAKGYDLIPKFKEIDPEIGIITMTGYNTRELELKVRQLGILYYLVKPFRMRELKLILDHYCVLEC